MKKILLTLIMSISLIGADDISKQVEIEAVKLENQYISLQQLLLRRFKYEAFAVFAIGSPNHKILTQAVKECINKLDDEIAACLAESYKALENV